MKKSKVLFYILCLIVFLPLTVLAGGSSDDNYNEFDYIYTSSPCILNANECSRTEDCKYINEFSCGMKIKSSVSYKCYYKFESGPIKDMVTAYFNQNGLSSVDYITNDPLVGEQYKAFVNGEQKPFTNEKSGVTYYTCPDVLYYSMSDTYTKKENAMNVTYRAFSTIKKDDSDKKFSLLKTNGYSGVMAIKKLPDSYEMEITPEAPKEPKICTYIHSEGTNNARELIITYHDSETVTATYTGGGADQHFTINTDFIKQSQEFKNWECPPKEKVYIVSTGSHSMAISYNSKDLEVYDSKVHEFEGSGGKIEEEPDTSIEICKVLPDSIKKYLIDALKLIRWISLVAMIILGTLDFVKATASNDQDAMKKASNNFIKRLIAVIILFLLPLLVELILYVAGLAGFGTCYPPTDF